MPDTQGANARGKVEGSHVGQKHLKNLKRKVYFFTWCHNNLCKQTQISPLSVDYCKARHRNLSNCITLHNLLSGVLKNNSPSM